MGKMDTPREAIMVPGVTRLKLVMVVKAMVEMLFLCSENNMSITSTGIIIIIIIITDQSTCRKWSTCNLEFQISEWVCETPTMFKGAMVLATVETRLAMRSQLLMGQGAMTRMSMLRWSGWKKSWRTRGGGRMKRKLQLLPLRYTLFMSGTRGRNLRRSWNASSLAQNTDTSIISSTFRHHAAF